ncbi:hypothetical protein BVG16_26085 [Paenibacillus selenitireducens]|uniref:Permease n=1 Tax=Paenibacillus selenitireducens TaxID=1324314 RepID=A0A1T2X298_9BACL|nr:hypothetical protein BVG16_26085 [Paenibacillus selenitireducens]
MTPKSAAGFHTNALAFVSLILIFILYAFSNYAPGTLLSNPKLQIFKTMFISIVLEAMPFILIGVIVSALIQVFVSDETVQRMIPKNPVLGIITASVLGIIFPICECGIVPAIRKLIKKGMPLHAATTFILVGPVLNPIVFWSTFTAFRTRPEITYTRMGLAFIVALIVGLFVYRFVRTDQLKVKDTSSSEVHQHHHDHHHHHQHHYDAPKERALFSNKCIEVMGHVVSEFFDMGKYLVFGSLLVALLQTFVANESLVHLGSSQTSANLLMMGLAFVLSLCSTSDAFVAQSFLPVFPTGSLIAFMVFGPMINLKGILMMLAVFRAKFVALLAIFVFVLVLSGSFLAEWLVFH